MRRTAFLAATFVLGAVTSARAESRSLRVDYQGARTCPDERRFVELTRERIRPWATIEDHGELVARVRTEQEGGGFAGRLLLEDATGTSLGVRTIQDADCEEVVLALALFLAVALEAEASNPHATPTTLADAPPAPATADARAPADVRALRPSPAPRSPEARAIAWQLLARAHGVTGRMPDTVPGGALAIELGPRWGSSMFRPYGSVGIDVAPYAVHREGRGHLELGWGAVFGRACAGLDLSGRAERAGDPWIEPWACARAEGGGLRAASRGYAVNRTKDLAWYAAGAEAGVSLKLSRLFYVGVFAGAMVPIVRHELALGDLQVFRAPGVVAEAGLELKVRIW